jgi:hypothetical protein
VHRGGGKGAFRGLAARYGVFVPQVNAAGRGLFWAINEENEEQNKGQKAGERLSTDSITDKRTETDGGPLAAFPSIAPLWTQARLFLNTKDHEGPL